MPNPETGRTPASRKGEVGLAVETSRVGGDCVLRLHGELDLRTVPELRTRLAEALERGDGSVVVDLSDVSFIDSTGLSALLNALRRLTRAGRRMAIVCQDGPVQRLLELTRLDGTFAVSSTVEAALAAIDGGRSAA